MVRGDPAESYIWYSACVKMSSYGFPEYSPRLVDSLVAESLNISGAVVLEGPRACGKTMTGLFHAKSAYFLDDDATQSLVSVEPDAVLTGERPVLLDEWQLEPTLWNRVRRAVDKSVDKGQFILTGSAVPADDVTRHTGAGRFLRLRMHTLTTSEKASISGGEPPTVSISALAKGDGVDPTVETVSLDEVLTSIVTSGFPAQVTVAPENSRRLLDSYLEDISRVDIHRLKRFTTSPHVIRQVIRAVARNVANEATKETLTKDVRTVDPDISVSTVAGILDALKRLFVVEEVPPFTVELRSRARLRKAGKYHLADPALAAAALNAGADELRADLKTAGYVFESAVIHDLMVYAQVLGGKLWHYRDSNGHEMDAVITFPDGEWAGIEVKLGQGEIESGAQSLRAVAAQISGPPPKFLAVITGTGYTANLGDNLVTFPLSALGM